MQDSFKGSIRAPHSLLNQTEELYRRKLLKDLLTGNVGDCLFRFLLFRFLHHAVKVLYGFDGLFWPDGLSKGDCKGFTWVVVALSFNFQTG